jgi:phospholipid N-methyltransferase
MKFGALIEKSVRPLLKDDGIFIQYMYCTALLKGERLRPILERYFRRVDAGFVFLNLPPTFVYTCRGRIASARSR